MRTASRATSLMSSPSLMSWLASRCIIARPAVSRRAPADGPAATKSSGMRDWRCAPSRTTHAACRRYKNEMEIELQERRFLERELRRALVEQSFALHYQPIVSADDHRIVGVEALLRWNHPTRGFIPPMTFVPVAEQAGLMGQLGEFVLRAALKDAQRWPDVFMAINISPMQLRQSDIAKTMSSLLAETDVAASRVLLEITEGVLVDEPKKTRMRLEQLRGLGLKIALDDFGAGYSNISYLQNFPIDKLKIDRSFVAALGVLRMPACSSRRWRWPRARSQRARRRR